MPVVDVASRFKISRHRVYQLARKRGRQDPVFQKLYISHARFEITMASISAYEAYLDALNDVQQRAFRPRRPLNLRKGVPA